MNPDQFTDALFEELFMLGLRCPARDLLSTYVGTEWANMGVPREPHSFIEKCVGFLRIEKQLDPQMVAASTSAGARDDWLAVHEAGHAIVVVRSGFALRGIRFYGDDGFPGETGFEEVDWRASTDEDRLRRILAVDVAGNVAESLHPAGRSSEGRLSSHYDDRTPGHRPSDFVMANQTAARLVSVLFERSGTQRLGDEFWQAKRATMQHAEAEARKIVQNSLPALIQLAQELRRGPMAGAAIRLIMEACTTHAIAAI